MSISKFLIIAAACAAVLSGCAKKEKAEDKEFSSTPKLAATAKSNTSDVFDEFYIDEKKPAPAQSIEQTRSSSFTPEFSSHGRYAVQVSTLNSRRSADKLSAELKSKGYPAYVANVDNPTPDLMGTYYRVRIGTFNLFSQAKLFGENVLKTSGFDYWVDKKSNDHVGIHGTGFGYGSSAGYAPIPPSPDPTPSSTPDPTPSYTPDPTPAYTPPPPAPEPVKPVVQPPAKSPAPSKTEKDEWGTDDWGSESGW